MTAKNVTWRRLRRTDARSVCVAFVAALCCVCAAAEVEIPSGFVFPPVTAEAKAQAVGRAAKYLALSPEKLASLVPESSPAPVTTETLPFSTSHNSTVCPFCGKHGSLAEWFVYDVARDPDHVRCATTKKDVERDFPADGEDVVKDWRGRERRLKYFVTPHLKRLSGSGPVKVYFENVAANERLRALCFGHWNGGAVGQLAEAWRVTRDERYAVRAIAVMSRLAEVFPAWPWTAHSLTTPLERGELLAKAKAHDAGYHGWLGPARLAAAFPNFRNPNEAVCFDHLARAFAKLADSASWKPGEKEKVLDGLFREGALNFHAYGAKQCVGNGIAMYAPGLHALGIVLRDRYLYGGFLRIMDEFLYNENFHDGISTEGSRDYAMMVSGMWDLFAKSGVADDPKWAAAHPFLKFAGRTGARTLTCRGGKFVNGDAHAEQYAINSAAPTNRVPGDEFGGYGLSIIRAGAADKRLEIMFHHDRVTGHAHDDMLGLQLFYRGIPLLEHFGDTRNTVDLDDKIADGEKIAALGYPFPIVRSDVRPRGFALQDVNSPLTKNVVVVDDGWDENDWYMNYHGGTGENKPWGNLIARTGRAEEGALQFVEAEGLDRNVHRGQRARLFKRAILAVVRDDGTPYAVDFLAVDGGHRHLFLLHSRGEEIDSSLGHGAKYAHLEDVPSSSAQSNCAANATSVLFPGRVLNEVDVGSRFSGAWRHAWKFDYAAWAAKSHPLPDARRVAPHVLGVRGFFTNPRFDARPIRARGHYPITIGEHIDGKYRQNRFQFENAVGYAGVVADGDTRLANCYVQCYECYADGEKPLFAQVTQLAPDDSTTSPVRRGAVELKFADGGRDVVIWQDAAEWTQWRNGFVATDARAALVRFGADGKIRKVALAGGTRLAADGKDVFAGGAGTLVGTLAAIEGDVSGTPEKSAFVLDGADAWPIGDALRGQTIVAAFNRGRRREAYEIERVERAGGRTCVLLAHAPFFVDHRGEVGPFGAAMAKPNEFCGTATAKGGNTQHLAGSRVVFPGRGIEATLGRVGQHCADYKRLYELSENLPLKSLVREGDSFRIEPDWRGARVELMTSAERELR